MSDNYRLNYEDIDGDPTGVVPRSQNLCRNLSINEAFDFAAQMEAEDFVKDDSGSYQQPSYQVAPRFGSIQSSNTRGN